MRKLLILSVLLVFVIGVAGSVLAKGEKKNKEDIQLTRAIQFCEANSNLGYSSFGECMGIFAVAYGPGKAGPVGVCSAFMNNNPENFYVQFNNLNECRKFLQTGYVHE